MTITSTKVGLKLAGNISHKFTRRSLIPVNGLWQIESGVVRTTTYFEDGNVATLGIWGEGDLIGAALSTTQPYQIECLTEVRLKVLSEELLPRYTKELILQMQRNEEFIKIILCRQTELAVMHMLNWLAKRFGTEFDSEEKYGQQINLRLTHQELAEIIGTTRVTMTRILNNFERQGLIQRHQHFMVIMADREDVWHYEI
ncbi:cAMP-binding protein [Synechococcus sp. PCC 7502]|uniref:Crp/Fnr family transcriptional regulator n=1 Tax=Synechococcus sp. PCC 7502 TaxID=1173263 RepID=UPI00029FAC71|nr:Crp/Fnr family transcriptional regulator [Synechococcus sp. PCC 7502]AFY74052.1 cAMP-binding protein [Synechococcus sp. PCC 7502]